VTVVLPRILVRSSGMWCCVTVWVDRFLPYMKALQSFGVSGIVYPVTQYYNPEHLNSQFLVFGF